MIAALQLYTPSESELSPHLPDAKLNLRGYYEKCVLPEIQEEQTKSSLMQDHVALNHWERFSGNPAIGEVSREHLLLFRDGLISRGLAPATINKTWRELRSIFNWATDEDVIPKSPKISRRSKSKLVKQTPKQQRETLSLDEAGRLFKACSKATYPAGGEIPAPKLW